MDFLEMYHVDLLICSNGINTASGLYKIFIQIFAVIAEFERDTLTERIVDNMMELAKDGRWLGGNTPTGFTVRRGKTGSGKNKSAYSYLESIPEEKAMIQKLYEIFTATRSIKKTADKEYPGLIKDIYIGKGNYNQELYPHALLLEFGTHKIEKDKAIGATGYMADVLSQVLYGETAKAEETASPAIKGIAWAVGIAIAGALIYALVSTGTFDGMKKKLARGVSEITGGAIGKKPNNR